MRFPVLLGALPALLLPLLTGCATHMQSLAEVRNSLVANDMPRAVQSFEKKKAKPDDLLWLLERAHLLHLNGRWEESNDAFERAERLADELYTKSLSKEALSLAISDKVLPYTSPLFEMTLIPYYRALNYMNLGRTEDALVEARKAAFQLSHLSEKSAEKNLRPLAFLNYVAGLLFADGGQWDSALLCDRAAYRIFGRLPGMPVPSSLKADYFNAARRMGADKEADGLSSSDPSLPDRAARQERQNVYLFVETGFAPYKSEVSIILPLLEPKEGESSRVLSRRYVDTYGTTVYQYQTVDAKLKKILKFAFPALQDFPSQAASCVAGPGPRAGRTVQPLLDLTIAAREEFDRRTLGLLLKTVARAIAKGAAQNAVSKKSEAAGWAVNLLNLGTEQADTRSWFLLPGRVGLLKLTLPTGSPQTVTVRALDETGNTVEERALPVTLKPGEVRWMSVRFFR